MSTFSELPLLSSLLTSLAEQGLTSPTPIQAQTIDRLLKGESVVGVAETGSGKTLAYVLPLLHQLKVLENEGNPVSKPKRPRGLVLVPGRELGEQVSKVFKSLTHGTRLRVRVALGGTPKQIAAQNVSGPFEVLVATPGRLLQLLDAHELHLEDLRTLVFDEADQLLDKGFLPMATRVVNEATRKLQIVMFSATLPQKLEADVAALCATEPMLIRTAGSAHLVSTLKTINRPVIKGMRYEVLEELLQEDATTPTILFVNTHEQVDKIAEWLDANGYDHVIYRGEMGRQERRANLAAFRDGVIALLVATDLGGRGLDIDRVGRIINVHLPNDIDNYLHRVGRTARAGREGLVVNLVTQRDHPLLTLVKAREKAPRA